jgi:hypothetical protein
MPPRRFPPPWTAEETDACFIVKDHSGQALAYLFSRTSPAGAQHCRGRRAFSELTSLSPVNKRVRVRLWLGSKQLRQLGDVCRDPPRLVAREEIGRPADGPL